MSLLTNLVAYWKLDEASGTRADSTANALDLADSGGTAVGAAAGKINDATSWAGSGEHLDHADDPLLSPGDTDFTFAAWINVSDTSANRYVLLKAGGANAEYYLGVESGALKWYVYGAAGFASGTSVTSSATISTGTWYHVVCWHDSVNNEIGLTVNAGTPDTAAHTTGVYDSADPFRLGGFTQFNNYWSGLIDEVGYWSRVLTSAERTSLYNGGSGLAYSSFGGGGGGGATAYPAALLMAM